VLALLWLWFVLPSPAPAADRLIILSPHPESIRQEFDQGFRRWHQQRFGTAPEIDWRLVGGSSESMRFVQSEYARKPDGIGIDLFFGGGQEPYYELASKKWAEPQALSPETLAGLPREAGGIELRAPDDSWYGAAVSSFGILANLRVQRLAHLPRVERWEDLTRPELRGWVGAGDPRGSGTMLVMFESFLQARGWQDGWRLLTQLAGNTRRFDRLSSTTAKDTALGETAYALCIDFFAFTQVAAAGRTNLTFILPKDFAAISPDGIALLRGAPNRAIALRFLEFVLSDDGQALWMLPKGHPQGPQRHSIERMPVRPALYQRYRDVSNIEFSPFDLTTGFRYDARLAQRRRAVVSILAGSILVDVHDDLKKAWIQLTRQTPTPSQLQQFGAVPITESEALALGGDAWKDPRFRNARRTEWQIWAQQKFRNLQSP
jgi:ABC-type Fe3+ transport system substrate-binding protein